MMLQLHIITTITLNVETGDKSGETVKNSSNNEPDNQATVIILNMITMAIWYPALKTIEWFNQILADILSMWRLDNCIYVKYI